MLPRISFVRITERPRRKEMSSRKGESEKEERKGIFAIIF